MAKKKKTELSKLFSEKSSDISKEEIMRLHRTLGKLFQKKLSGDKMTSREIIAFEEVLTFIKTKVLQDTSPTPVNYDEFH